MGLYEERVKGLGNQYCREWLGGGLSLQEAQEGPSGSAGTWKEVVMG